MACEDIENRLSDLRSQKRELNQVMGNLQGAGLQAAQANLARIEDQIAVEEVHLENCRAIEQQETKPTPRPFVARVKNIFCAEASKEIGKDEPYLLITTVDMLSSVQIGPLPVLKPTLHCFKVGPWSGITPGTWHNGGANSHFWDINGRARQVASPQNVIFLVSLLEHDGSSPESIRQALETSLEASLLNMGPTYTYSTVADTLASNMTGTFDTVRLLGLGTSGANADDRIDATKQLNLTTNDLNTINALGKHEKLLTFTNRNSSDKVTNQYTVTFLFET